MAICIMYMMVESKVVDPLVVGGHVLAGYYQHMQLNATERDLLKTCVAGRFCQSLVRMLLFIYYNWSNKYNICHNHLYIMKIKNPVHSVMINAPCT